MGSGITIQQLLAMLPSTPQETPVSITPLHLSDREYCLGCQVFVASTAQCRHCKGPYCSDRCKKQDGHLHVCEFNYTVEVSIRNVPGIGRTLSIPYTTTFEELHQALQIAFSWRPTTDYEFAIGRLLITSRDRMARLMLTEENAYFKEFKDGRTTYIVEGMTHTFADRKIIGYLSDVSSTLVHKIKIQVWNPPKHFTAFQISSEIRCVRGHGHSFAQGFTRDEWDKLKIAYNKEIPTTAEKALIEDYKLFCPNADQYGLSGSRVNEFDIDAVNARLKRLPIGLTTFPDHFRRIWLGPEEEQLSLLEQAFKELSLDCLDE